MPNHQVSARHVGGDKYAVTITDLPKLVIPVTWSGVQSPGTVKVPDADLRRVKIQISSFGTLTQLFGTSHIPDARFLNPSRLADTVRSLGRTNDATQRARVQDLERRLAEAEAQVAAVRSELSSTLTTRQEA